MPKNSIKNIVCWVLAKFKFFHHADSFLNYSLKRWQDLFVDIFEDKIIYLHFTGGEPLLRHREITKLVETTAYVSKDFIIRIDINGSIIPDFPSELKEKITHNISYHKSQIDFNKFLHNLDKIANQGKIYMINRVIADEEDFHEALKENEIVEIIINSKKGK